MTNFNKVISNTTYYTLSTILLRASSLIFFPIFSLYLTKSDYGTFSVVQSIVMVVGLLGGLGLNRSLTRFVYYNSDLEENDHNTIIYTTLISNFFGQLFFILLFIFFWANFYWANTKRYSVLSLCIYRTYNASVKFINRNS